MSPLRFSFPERSISLMVTIRKASFDSFRAAVIAHHWA